jgi:preprotein translocase subunit SecY
MFANFFRKLKLIASDKTLYMRIAFIIAMFALFRFLAAIAIPGIDQFRLESFLNNNQFIGLLSIFSGGGFAQLSIVMLGVAPYINASIIMQLGTIVFPPLKAMYSEEGEAGRAKFTSWTRLLSVPIAVLQSIAFLSLLESQAIISALTPFDFAVNVLMVSAGSILLMWIGELISEYGIGNGISLIIFAGIVATLPASIAQALFTATVENIPLYIGFAVAGLLAIAAVVYVYEAERSIPIMHARNGNGGGNVPTTYLPIRLLQAGVIPIIFALSLLLLPQMALSGLKALGVGGLDTALTLVTQFVANPYANGSVYFVLVVMFTFFYTSIIFEPKKVSDNLQKQGAFIPGVRPGVETEHYLKKIVQRITLPGAVFLGLLAVIPFIIQGLTGVTAVLVGGTSLLIAVNVLLDVTKKIDAQVSLREY